MSTKVGQRGQITIEQPIREALGIEAGWRAVQRIQDDSVVIHFLPPKHNRSLAGILSDATTVRIPTQELLEEAIEETWAAEVASRENGRHGAG